MLYSLCEQLQCLLHGLDQVMQMPACMYACAEINVLATCLHRLLRGQTRTADDELHNGVCPHLNCGIACATRDVAHTQSAHLHTLHNHSVSQSSPLTALLFTFDGVRNV